MPESPPYFPKDELLTGLCASLFRRLSEKRSLQHTIRELPYSCEVEVQSYKEEETIVKIEANILVIRESQKGIVIGHQGKKIKHVGISARKTYSALSTKRFTWIYASRWKRIGEIKIDPWTITDIRNTLTGAIDRL